MRISPEPLARVIGPEWTLLPSTHPLHILVVDDDHDVNESTVALLALHGFRATGALAGEEALRLVAGNPPDVALIDMEMPGMGGYEVALRLGHLGLLQPPMLIAVTGRSLSWDRGRAAAAGFSVYLVKPVPPDELVTLLNHCATARAEKP